MGKSLNKRELKVQQKANSKNLLKETQASWEAFKMGINPENDIHIVSSQFKRRTGLDSLKADFRPDWFDRVEFEICDAAKYLERYADSEGKDFTHIYSYNKVMSTKDTFGISQILNRTNFRLLAWYFGPEKSQNSGLKHFRLVHQEPMQSTGKEKFTVYVYAKTRLYVPEDAEAWSSETEEELPEKESVAHNPEVVASPS